MAKRKAEVDDDGEERAVFVDTSLDTHLVLLVSPTDTFSLLKQKILVEHPKCFPDFGDIKINALKVKRRGCYYHLLDSMLVRTAFYGMAKNWFLLADVYSQTACCLAPYNVIPIEPSKALLPLVASSDLLEPGVDQHEDDHVGNHPSDASKMLGLEMPYNFDISGVHIECKEVEETLNDGDLKDSSDKKNTKKRKRTGQQDGAGNGNGERLESLNHEGKEPPSTENDLRNVGNGTKLINNLPSEASPSAHARKKHKVVNKDVQETLLNTKSFISDSNRVDPESKASVRKSDQGDILISSFMDVNGERLESVNCVGEVPPSKENDVRNGGNDTNLRNNVADGGSLFSHTKKKPKVVNEEAEETSSSETKSVAADSNRENPELEDVVSKSDQGDVQRTPSIDMNELAPSGTSEVVRKRKKGKKQATDGLPSSKVNKEENLMHIKDHAHNASALATEAVAELEGLAIQGISVQSSAFHLEDGDDNLAKDVEEGTVYKAEGTSASLDPLANNEIEINRIVVALESRAKKPKKAKKGDVDGVAKSNCTSEIPDAPKNGCAPTLNENTILGQEDSMTGSMELGAKPKKKKAKKGTWDGEKEAEDTGKIGVEPMLTTETKGPDVSTKIRGEKVKRKAQKKQTVSGKDTTVVSVEEQSYEKITETDAPKMVNVVPLGNGDVEGAQNLMAHAGDLHEYINKTPPTEVSADVMEVRKTDRPRASKRKVKKHDLSSSIDTSCSGQNMVVPKKSRGSARTFDDGAGLKADDEEGGSVKGRHTEPVHPINKDEYNMEISSDKPKKRSEKKQTSVNEPPKSPMKQQSDEKTREMALPISTDECPLAHAAGHDADHQQGLSRMENHNENLEDIPPSDSASLADMKNQEKQHASKEDLKKLDLPSSIDTSSNQTSFSKLKKSKGSKRLSENGTQLHGSITDQQCNIFLTQPSERHAGTPREIEPQTPICNGNKSVAKLALHDQNAGARKSSVPNVSLDDGSKLPGASMTSCPVRKTHQGKKAKEQQKKLDERFVGSKRSSLQNLGEIVNSSAPKKGLLATPGAIFEDGSSGSSDDDDDDKMEGLDTSTRTPSDNLSSSDYSEGESKGDVVTSRHDASKGGGQDGTNPKSSGIKNMTLHSILRSSSRYRKAKVVASQSQLEDSEPVDFVPDSQGNL